MTAIQAAATTTSSFSATSMRCSCCRREKPAEWFPPRKGKRGRGYVCRTCKRKMDLRRFYRLQIARLLDRIDAIERKLAAVVKDVGPGKR